MLTAEMNQRLTQVGPNTPMGSLMRCYWQPFLPADRLLDNPVQQVRLLGEDLVCYMDRAGTIGLVGDRCCHRLVGLKHAIPQDQGLRCMYHGWCYDETGACTDTPFEPKTSRMKEHIHLKAYPVQQMGGLLFAYLGPAPAPLLPPWELFVFPNALRQIGHTLLDCNWLQCQENGADPIHTIYTHGYFSKYIHEERGGPDVGYARFLRPEAYEGFSHIVSKVDEFGLQRASVYKKELGAKEDSVQWRSNPTIFPNIVRVGQTNASRQEYQIRVPVDDEHTMIVAYQTYLAPPEVAVPPQDVIPSYEIPLFDDLGRENFDHNNGADYFAWSSQGAVMDRTIENLGVTDSAVRAFRDLLEQQIELVEAGSDPMNTYRDPAAMPGVIHSEPRVGDWESLKGKSLALRDVVSLSDQYGRINDQVEDLWRRIKEHEPIDIQERQRGAKEFSK